MKKYKYITRQSSDIYEQKNIECIHEQLQRRKALRALNICMHTGAYITETRHPHLDSNVPCTPIATVMEFIQLLCLLATDMEISIS